MTSGPKSPVFLEQASYRQRRWRDAVRLLPVLGLVLWSIPLLWPSDPPDAPASSGALTYVFGVWVFLIVLSALISRVIRADDTTRPTDPKA